MKISMFTPLYNGNSANIDAGDGRRCRRRVAGGESWLALGSADDAGIFKSGARMACRSFCGTIGCLSSRHVSRLGAVPRLASIARQHRLNSISVHGENMKISAALAAKG